MMGVFLRVKSMFFLLFLPWFCSGQAAAPQLRFSSSLDPSHRFSLRWDHVEQEELMMFELQVHPTGWVAFGFSPHGELPGSDIVIGAVFPNGSIYFSDCHVVDETTLEEDESQDYQLLSVTENATSTTLLFKHRLRTCDPNDLDITMDTARLIAAFGIDDTVQFFKGQRFSKSLFLMRYGGPSDLTDPKIFFTYDLRMDNFEPVITPHNITLVHHILVYGCGNASLLPSGTGDCYGPNPDPALCSQVLVGWAVGGESYQFPDEAAISIGTPWDPQYVRLEIHYSNFDLLPGLIDSSGVRIYYTPELRKYDVGILQTGVFIFPVHFIPPGAESYRSYGLCNSSQFDEELLEVSLERTTGIYLGCAFTWQRNFTGFTMLGPCPAAMSSTAFRAEGQCFVMEVLESYFWDPRLFSERQKFQGTMIADMNGEQLGVICEDSKYDFTLQETWEVKEILIIKAGDEILVERNFQPLDRSGITFGGLSTMNEMCLAFLFYYPRNNISSCMGYSDILYIAHALNQEASDPVEGLMATNFVDWDDETVKIAEKAAKEADQVVMIKTMNELQRNETGLISDITTPEQAACHNISGSHSVSGLRATANFCWTAVCTSDSSATTETASFRLLSLTQMVLAWFILASEYGK